MNPFGLYLQIFYYSLDRFLKNYGIVLKLVFDLTLQIVIGIIVKNKIK